MRIFQTVAIAIAVSTALLGCSSEEHYTKAQRDKLHVADKRLLLAREPKSILYRFQWQSDWLLQERLSFTRFQADPLNANLRDLRAILKESRRTFARLQTGWRAERSGFEPSVSFLNFLTTTLS